MIVRRPQAAAPAARQRGIRPAAPWRMRVTGGPRGSRARPGRPVPGIGRAQARAADEPRAHAQETAASAAQYLLLGGFTAVAAGISAQGLTGFARENMGLTGPWPYLLFLALDARPACAPCC